VLDLKQRTDTPPGAAKILLPSFEKENSLLALFWYMSIGLSADANSTNVQHSRIELHIGTELYVPAT
jgi:hypothetical protein